MLLVHAATPAGDPDDIQSLLNITQAAEDHIKAVEKVKNVHDRIKEIARLKALPLSSSQEDGDDA